MTHDEIKDLKERTVAICIRWMAIHADELRQVDSRLPEYALGVASLYNCNACVWEVLGLRQFFNKLDNPDIHFNAARVTKMIQVFESLKSDTMRGNTTVRATPQQVFIIANIYGFYHFVDTGQRFVGQKLLPTEENRYGAIWDFRRLTTDADLFIPRKFGKTHMAAFFCFIDFFSGDHDSETYCTANALSQSRRLYQATQQLIMQKVPQSSGLVRYTATETNWVWPNPHGRKGTLVCLSAGGKTKDGLKASTRCADEFGSASFVKDHSDMSQLVGVVDSSMGPRREPLRITTTTAGRVISGPYMQRIEAIKQAFLDDTVPPTLFAYILQPDPWEVADEDLCLTTESVWRKVNPHLGITVQSDFYEKEIARARLDPDYRKEVLTKLFNIFQSDAVQDWIRPQRIRELQQQRSIMDLNPDDGWVIFTGMDFSSGDDLCGISYLAARRDPATGAAEFFADCDAWIAEDNLREHTNGLLYQQWVDAGYLHTSPGRTIDEHLVTNRIIEVSDHIPIMRMGFDAYDAQRFVNDLRVYVYGLGQDPDVILRPVKQTFAAYNSPVEEMTFMIENDPPLIHFSDNPLWVWEFSNVCLAESTDGMGNKKPVKRSQRSTKIDNVQALLNALSIYDDMDGREQ